MRKKNVNIFLAALVNILLLLGACGVLFAADFEDAEEALQGLKEGWAWPVVVVAPPEGWASEQGEAIKWSMRAAEREISLNREAIRGREVTFMFSSVANSSELVERIKTWRAMGVAAIVSFGDDGIGETLSYLCRDDGPSVLFAGGENAAVLNPTTTQPYRHLFALDLPYFARANALAELATQEDRKKRVAVISDILSERLAKGARLNVELLRARDAEVLDLSVTGFRQDQFVPQIRDFESGGFRIFSVWLDAMATLSIWRTTHMNRNGSEVHYAGNMHRLLLDAEGLLLVDKDVLLERNERGKNDIITIVRDRFNRRISEPVLGAKAYALAKWVLAGYTGAGSAEPGLVADALARAVDIPLMDEMLRIDPTTHRPNSRKFGVLRVEERAFKSAGSVEVFSREVSE